MSTLGMAARVVTRALGNGLAARTGRFRGWPSQAVLIDEPLALAEQRTSRLRRIYNNAGRDLWDGPELFRQRMSEHGGIQLEREKKIALSHPISMLMWGELAAWIVSAELAERLDDPDARMAASSQVFDEARHFYVLRDYLAALHVPVPALDPYFAVGARRLLATRDLVVKLMAMQILAEGTAQAIFRFLADARIEPVLSDLLPYIERDEARHVGLGVLHLPALLADLSPRRLRKLRSTTAGIGDLFGATQIRFIEHYRTLGADPRELFRSADRMLFELSAKLGTLPTGERILPVPDPRHPDYEKERLDLLFAERDGRPQGVARAVRSVIDWGARVLPS